MKRYMSFVAVLFAIAAHLSVRAQPNDMSLIGAADTRTAAEKIQELQTIKQRVGQLTELAADQGGVTTAMNGLIKAGSLMRRLFDVTKGAVIQGSGVSGMAGPWLDGLQERCVRMTA